MWTELNRRCDTDMGDHEDVELNPCQIDTFVAELVGQEDGRTLYCTACWTPFMPQIYSFSVTDESIYGWIVDYEREDNGQLAAIRARGPVNCEADEDYDGPYAEQFRQLLRELRRLGRPGQPVKAASHAGGRLSPAGKYYQGKDTRPHFQGRVSFLMRDSTPPKYANPICKNTP